MVSFFFLISTLFLPFSNGIAGEYIYVSKDFHHPTLSKLNFCSNQQFELKRSNLFGEPHLVIKGSFKISSDTLVLDKSKMVFKGKRRFGKKRQVTKCVNNYSEIECKADTFLVREDGLYEYQYFVNPAKAEWVLTYKKEND